MIFEGNLSLDTKGKPYTGKPIFDSRQSVMVFDIDDTLLLQKGNFEKGIRNGGDKYKLHHQAKDIVRQALYDFDKVVLWTARPRALENFSGQVFDDVHLRIAGGVFVNDMIIKDLRILSEDLSRVVAVQDGIKEISFEPLNRVVQVEKGEDLKKKLNEARVLVYGLGFKTGRAFEPVFSQAASFYGAS